jgi:hypothetical protein
MKTRITRLTLATLLVGGAGGAFAQGMPTTQPGMVTIVREDVKPGRNAEHQRIEAGWPAAYEKAKSTFYYLAFESMTGPNEAWFVVPFASHAAQAESMKQESSDPVLAAELARLSRADGEVLNNIRVMQARARPDLSMGKFPDLATQRYWEISWFRVRPGHEAEFDSAAKAYGSAAKRSAPASNYRVYEIIAGVPGPTYLIFSSVSNYATFDQMAADGEKTFMGATPDEMGALQKYSLNAAVNFETERFRLNPVMSFVSKETRASDPSFWSPPKKAAAKASTQP